MATEALAKTEGRGDLMQAPQTGSWGGRMFEGKKISLSNVLAQARAKSNLLESKIEFLAIYKMKDSRKMRTRIDAQGNPYSVSYVEVSAAEVKELSGLKGGSLYTEMQKAALFLKMKLYMHQDIEKREFKLDSMYGEVAYRNGVMTVEFNPDMEYLFTDLVSHFTQIQLSTAFRFKTNGGFQLYKLLKSYAYKLDSFDIGLPQEEQPSIIVEFDINTLRSQLGYINLSQPEVKMEASKPHPDPDKIAALERKPKYKRWVDFRRNVIAPGVEEVNNISDLYIAGIDKSNGGHGKLVGVSIILQHNCGYYLRDDEAKVRCGKGEGDAAARPCEAPAAIPADEEDDFLDEMRNVIKEPLKTKDLRLIAKEAGYDIGKVRTAYAAAESYSKEIENLTGFLLSAVRNGYAPPVRKAAAPRKGTGWDFEEREYDYDELLKQFAKN